VHKWGKYVQTHIAPHLGIVRWAALGGAAGPEQVQGFARLPHERRALWERAAAGFDADQVAASRRALLVAVDRLAADLAEGEWLAGPALTLADVVACPHVRQLPAGATASHSETRRVRLRVRWSCFLRLGRNPAAGAEKTTTQQSVAKRLERTGA
jgi:glutathione S-transferase